jgi:hypothetical protein
MVIRFFVQALFYSVFVFPKAHADWVEVTGSASVDEQTYDEAREQVQQEALRQALLSQGIKLESHQYIKNGKLLRDELKVDSDAHIRRIELRNEELDGDSLTLTLGVDIDRLHLCPDSQAAKYRKTVALLGFSLQTPDQANWGDLHSVSRGLSSSINEALQQHEKLLVFESSEHSLYGNVRNAPSYLTQSKTLTKASTIIRQSGAQFVLSGVVRDMGLQDSGTYETSIWGRTMRSWALANETRRFSMELFVHDGFSGELISQSNFATEGDWNVASNQKIGFASQAFWKTNYGDAIHELIDEIAYYVDEQLQCQPFMTRISRVDGKNLQFKAGAASGIRPGDQFSVYRSFSFSDPYSKQQFELTNVKTALTVSQVHPSFGTGTIEIEAGRINVQQDDLLIVW